MNIFRRALGMGILFVSMTAFGEPLAVTTFRTRVPDDAPSCGLLHQRALERAKVTRELAYLTRQSLRGDERALAFSGALLANKMFMPRDVWSDLALEVDVEVRASDALLSEIKSLGLAAVFIRTQGPGYVWQSEIGQQPEGASIALDAGGKLLKLTYWTYLNVACESPNMTPEVEWVPHDKVNAYLNSSDVLARLRAALP